MQLVGVLIFISIFLVILGACIYFARHQNPKPEHYGSWSNVLGPQFNGQSMDVAEGLNKTINAGRRQARRAQRIYRARKQTVVDNKHKDKNDTRQK